MMARLLRPPRAARLEVCWESSVYKISRQVTWFRLSSSSKIATWKKILGLAWRHHCPDSEIPILFPSGWISSWRRSDGMVAASIDSIRSFPTDQTSKNYRGWLSSCGAHLADWHHLPSTKRTTGEAAEPGPQQIKLQVMLLGDLEIFQV